MDLGVNKPIKETMKNEFTAWNGDKVQMQLENGMEPSAIKINLNISGVKPLATKWFIKAHGVIGDNPSIVVNSFTKAGNGEIIS